MAGNWIKLRHDLLDAPEVRRLARATGLDRDQVYGKLFRLWSWADRHGLNGHIGAELEDVDDQVGHVGFGAALVSVGWLVAQDGGIEIPHWERHFSDSAKARGLSAKRMEKARYAPRVTDQPDPVTRGAQPEKTREEENNPPPPREASQEEAVQIRRAWAALVKSGHGKAYHAKAMPDALPARLAEPGWLADAMRAIEHLPRCRFFSSPPTLFQLCKPGFVAKVLAGQYDEAKASKGGPPRPGDVPPLRIDPAFAAAREATERRERERMEAEHRRLDEAAITATALPRAKLKLVREVT